MKATLIRLVMGCLFFGVFAPAFVDAVFSFQDTVAMRGER
jgi:hypothetical protein